MNCETITSGPLSLVDRNARRSGTAARSLLATSRRAAVVLLATGLITALATSASAADTTVPIHGFAYVPATIKVHVGDSVIWANEDTAPHSATADDGSFNTGLLELNRRSLVAFTTAGTFAYHCSAHPEMVGTVVVLAAAAPATDTAASITPSGRSRLDPFVAVSLAIFGAVIAALRFRRERDRVGTINRAEGGPRS